MEKIIYNKSFPSDGDAFLIIIEEDSLLDKLVFVEEIKEKVILKMKMKMTLILYLDDEKNIILQSDDYQYEIVEFEKIQEIEQKDLEDDKLFLTKDVYDDIDLDVEELKEKIYSIVERKESLITELISLFGAQNNKNMIIDFVHIQNNTLKC